MIPLYPFFKLCLRKVYLPRKNRNSFVIYIYPLDVQSFVNLPQCHQTHQSVPVCLRLHYLICLKQYINLMHFLLSFLHPVFFFEHLKYGKECILSVPFRFIEIKLSNFIHITKICVNRVLILNH